jgi:hypothetical protein
MLFPADPEDTEASADAKERASAALAQALEKPQRFAELAQQLGAAEPDAGRRLGDAEPFARAHGESAHRGLGDQYAPGVGFPRAPVPPGRQLTSSATEMVPERGFEPRTY